MGIYINPKEMSKESWLVKFAIPDERPELIPEDVPSGMVPLCLVDNEPFTALAVCHSQGELMTFSDNRDTRPKRWFYATIPDILESTDQPEHIVVGALKNGGLL